MTALGLDLPIDHFRLLGVSPSTDAQGVLRTLQLRLDRVPQGGFTAETLQARAELLRASADLLSAIPIGVPPMKRSSPASPTPTEALQPGLEIASTRAAGRVAAADGGRHAPGSLHAGQPLLCSSPRLPPWAAAAKPISPCWPGRPACAAAGELEEQRRFEAAAQTLQQGLQLLQRLGKRPELRETMHAQLERLTPYRVLDLLSRELAAGGERREGLELLEQLVQRRGGLEGEGDPHFPSRDFKPFFHQIRAFLTVQEQVDLFSRWAAAGSEAADFLATISLTASGFAQRKPERIAQARDRLLRSGREDVEPLLANLHLLLGEADTARDCFERGASQELRDWAAGRSSDPLGQLCAYCSDWLARDVLPGYRDLEAEPDLVAYFSDRDVVTYVEREDQRRGRSYLSAPPPAEGGGAHLLRRPSTTSPLRRTAVPCRSLEEASNAWSGFSAFPPAAEPSADRRNLEDFEEVPATLAAACRGRGWRWGAPPWCCCWPEPGCCGSGSRRPPRPPPRLRQPPRRHRPRLPLPAPSGTAPRPPAAEIPLPPQGRS